MRQSISIAQRLGSMARRAEYSVLRDIDRLRVFDIAKRVAKTYRAGEGFADAVFSDGSQLSLLSAGAWIVFVDGVQVVQGPIDFHFAEEEDASCEQQ